MTDRFFTDAEVDAMTAEIEAALLADLAPPLVKGGQGRSGAEITDSARIATFIGFIGIVLAAADLWRAMGGL